MQPVLAPPVGVALQHHGLHVIEQHLPRHPAEVAERRLQAGLDRWPGFVDYEPHEAHPAVAERRHKRAKPLATAAEHHEINLHLLTRFGLEANEQILTPRRRDRLQEHLQLGEPAAVPALLDLT